jgi:hypothetical protein
MIIWSVSTRLMGAEAIKAKCSHCHHEGLVLERYQRFFKLFYIPTLALRKSAALVCEACGTQYSAELLNSSSKAIVNLATTSKTPWWGFIGLYIIAVLIGIGTWSAHIENQQKAKYLAAPHVNDILVIKNKAEQNVPYYFIKITDISNDKIHFITSKYNYSNLIKMRDTARKASGFDFLDGHYEVSLDELKKQDIEAIYRD